MSSFEDETRRLLAERLRRALALVALSIVLFAVLELVERRAPSGPFVAIKLVQSTTVAVVSILLRGTPSWRRCIIFGLLTAVEVCATLAASGILTGDVASAPLLFIVFTMASATLLPWGALPQLVVACTATAALAVNVARVPEVPPGFAYTGTAAVIAVIASVYVAFEMDRHRRSLHGALEDVRATADNNARLAADLAEASRAKTEFLATMSHELRTPLNIILGFTEMAEDDAIDAATRQDLVQRIRSSGQDLLELVENTLDIGRMEVGRDAARCEPIELDALWSALGIACVRLPRRPGVTLEWDTCPAETVVTDPRKVSVIVKNLVNNALKFTERGFVRAGLVVRQDVIVIAVRDTGIGIRAEDRDRIFESFTQADGADTRRYNGIGLGLHIVRRFTQSLGGSIAVESVRGAGSTFSVTIPRVIPDVAAAA